jgi:ankyrin repeat protein
LLVAASFLFAAPAKHPVKSPTPAQVEAIIKAVERGDLALINRLLKQNPALVNAKQGVTPLHIAVALHNLKVVKLLISKGANVNTPDQLVGLTPLHYALWGSREMVQLLISKGADVNAKTGSMTYKLSSHLKIPPPHHSLKTGSVDGPAGSG